MVAVLQAGQSLLDCLASCQVHVAIVLYTDAQLPATWLSPMLQGSHRVQSMTLFTCQLHAAITLCVDAELPAAWLSPTLQGGDRSKE